MRLVFLFRPDIVNTPSDPDTAELLYWPPGTFYNVAFDYTSPPQRTLSMVFVGGTIDHIHLVFGENHLNIIPKNFP